jgi:superfamily II DNA or RNA helicase
MEDILRISKINETHIKVDCEPSVAMELSDYFTVMVPNAKFHPLYKNRVWDGKIRLYNVMSKLIYAGLLENIKEFAEKRDYEIELLSDFNDTEFSLIEAEKYIKTLNIPFEPRDYQVAAFAHGVRKNRALLLSPTASGKSLIIYLLTRYYNAKTLIIVPTISLVHQLASDFSDYGYNDADSIHRITSGVDKQTDRKIVISTWQSIYKLGKEFFKQFDVVIGDECHLFKAKSLSSIMEKLANCRYRFGFTGTLDGTETNKLVLEGLFGPVKRVASTVDLIEKKHLADLKIKILLLKYSDDVKKQNKNNDYQTEIDFIVRHLGRNKFIKNLTLSLKGNTLLLFQYVDKHGKELYADINSDANGRKVFFIHGGVDGSDREDIRRIVEKEKDAIIIASSGTFSTGVNIKNLHNIIFSSPSKSKIKTLQSIGRGLRKSDTKESMTLFDIADDLSWKSKTNYTLEHFKERLKIYASEGFDYKIYSIDIKG